MKQKQHKHGDGTPNRGGDKTAFIPKKPKGGIPTSRRRFSRRGSVDAAHGGIRPGKSNAADEKPKAVADKHRPGPESDVNYVGGASKPPKRFSRRKPVDPVQYH